MKAYLIVARGEAKDKEYSIEVGRNLIGRWDPDSGAFPEIDLEAADEESKISRKHAVISFQNDRIMIEDLGSLNGTFINRGPRLEEGVQAELRDGDELVIGKTFLFVKVAE